MMDPLLSNECPMVIKQFLGYMQTIKGKSEKTVSEYYLDLRTFFRFIKLKNGLVERDVDFKSINISDVTIDLIKDITLTDIYEFFNYTLMQMNNSATTRARKAACLRTFFKYLTSKTGQLKNNPTLELDTPKKKKSLPKYLTLEESIELLNSVTGTYKERDYCILTLFLNCGMRLSELVNINISDIRRDNTLRLLGKGNKERIVYLNTACIDAIERYKKVRPNEGVKDKKAFFISRHLNRINVKSVQALVNKYIRLSGLEGKGYSVHKLRHTAATLMYQHGHVDVRVLKDILGHENLGTTEIYTHVSNEQCKEAVIANPLSKVKARK